MTYLILFPTAGSEAAGRPERDFMSWRLVEHKRVSDGGQTAVYELLMPEGRNIENLNVYYIVQPRAFSRGSGLVTEPDEIYVPSLSGSREAPLLSIYSGRSARLEILAGALIDGRFHLARTFLNVYGDSGRSDLQARKVAARPEWIGLSLAGGAAYYRAEAGEELKFRLGPEEGHAVTVRAFEEGVEAPVKILRGDDGLYSYTPPSYPRLSAPGYSVTRDLVLVAWTARDEVLSYYLPVGRSRYGQVSVRPGLATVALAALAGMLTVLLAGRSFKWR